MPTADAVEICSCFCEAWLAAQVANDAEIELSDYQGGTLDDRCSDDCFSESDEEEPDPYNYHENYGSGGTGGVFHRGRLVYSRLTPASAMIVPLRLILAEEVHADWNELQKEIDCFSCPVDDLETPYDVQRLRDSPLAKLPSAIGLGYGRLDEASAAHWWQPEWSANISPPPMFLEEPEPAFEHEAPPLFHPIPVSARNLASVPLLEAHSSLWREAASYPACTLGCSLPDDLKPSSEPEESDWPTMPLGTAGQLDGDDDAIRYARSTAKHELHDELHDDAYYDSEVDAYIPLHLRRKGPRDLELATTRQKRKSQIHPWKARVRREKNERAQFESDGIMDTKRKSSQMVGARKGRKGPWKPVKHNTTGPRPQRRAARSRK